MVVNLKVRGVQRCKSAEVSQRAERATSVTSDFAQSLIVCDRVNILLTNILKPLSGLSSARSALITVITPIHLFTYSPPALLYEHFKLEELIK